MIDPEVCELTGKLRNELWGALMLYFLISSIYCARSAFGKNFGTVVASLNYVERQFRYHSASDARYVLILLTLTINIRKVGP